MKNNVFMNAISSIFSDSLGPLKNAHKPRSKFSKLNINFWTCKGDFFKKLEYRYFTFYVTYSIDGKETYKIISFCNTSLNIFPKNVLICHIKRKIGASLQTFFFRFRTVGFPRKVCQNTKINHKKVESVQFYSI